MDKVYEELVEAKAEAEKLEEELRRETDSCQNLKISHDAKFNELQEAKFKVENQDQELLHKEDKINDAKQMYEDLTRNSNDKESIINLLSAENDKLQADCDDKFRTLEDEKRELALVLDEANEKARNQDQPLNEDQQEIECLKKKEQFQLLEESHEKLKDQFISTKNEWEMEKSTLLDEISSLQKKLDSQITTSEDLQHQLQIRNEALTAEQSQRKHLEVEVSDFKDKDVKDLKSSPEAKEEHYKELKNKIAKLEQENHKLRKPLRELQEAQIKESAESASSYALPRLRSELRNLEKIHKECVANFRARQAEWRIQLEQLTEVAVSCRSELQTKTAAVEDLKMELECSHSLASELMLLNEELSVTLLVVRQGVSEADSNLFNDDKKVDLIKRGRKEKFHQLIHQSDMYDSNAPTMELREKALQMEIDDSQELKEAYDAWDMENDELAGRTCEIGEMELELQTWMFIVERLKNDIEENLVMRKELENSLLAQVEFSQSLKQEIEEKENTINYLQEQVVSLKQQLKTRDAEAMAVPSETGDVRYLQIIEEKDKALEDLQSLKQEIKEKDKALEGLQSLKQEIEEKENSIDYLQERVVSLKQQLKTRDAEETAVPTETGEVRYLQIIEEKEKALEDLQSLKQEIEEKDNSIDYLQERVVSLKQQLKTRDAEETAVPTETGEVRYLQIIEEKEKALEDLQSLKQEIEEKDNSIDYLQERVVTLKQQLKTRGTESKAVPSETGEVRYLQIIEEKDKALEDLQKEVVFLEQEYMRREHDSAVTTKSSMKRTNELEKENPDAKVKNVRIDEKVKNVRIDEIMDQVTSVEEHFTNSLTYCSSQLAEKQAQINQLQEAWDKIMAAEILAVLEIEEKKFMIMELEDDIRAIEQKVKLQERNWSQTKQHALDIDAEMDAKKEKIKELTDHVKNNLRGSDVVLQELQMENRNLLENATRLSSESFENDSAGMILEKEDGFHVKENTIMHSSSKIKNPETISDIR